MKEKYIKFITTDIALSILYVAVLIPNYSVVGLISVLLGCSILFYVTLNKNSYNSSKGVAYQFSFLFFISVLTLMGIWLSKFLSNGLNNLARPHFHFLILIFLALAIVCLVFCKKLTWTTYLLYCLFKYLGLICVFFSISLFFQFSSVQMLLILFIFAVYCLYNIFICIRYSGNEDALHLAVNDPCAKLSIILNSILSLSFFCAPDYWNSILGKIENFPRLISKLLEQNHLTIFVMITFALTIVYLVGDVVSQSEFGVDPYFSACLSFSVILTSVVIDHASWISLILAIAAVIAFLVIGLRLPLLTKDSIRGIIDEKPVEELTGSEINKAIVAFDIKYILLSLAIFIFFNGAIRLIYLGHVIPVIIILCLIAVVVPLRKLLQKDWLKKCIWWQLVLIALCVSFVSLSYIKDSSEKVVMLLIPALAIFSAFLWILGMKYYINKKPKVDSNVVISVIYAIICIVSLI